MTTPEQAPQKWVPVQCDDIVPSVNGDYPPRQATIGSNRPRFNGTNPGWQKQPR
jgi:hypothetical protein